jgi:hypothetical protein
MRNRFPSSCRILLAALVLALPACAQISLGDFKLNMDGNLMFGYGGSFGDTGASSHNLLIGGNGQVNGSYYNPKFISFSLQPYYNRNQDNSAFQAVSNTEGLSGTVSFLSGSHFPGSFQFTDNRNSTDTLGLLGSGGGGLATNASGRSWTLGWSALLPKLPTLSFSYSKGSGTSEVYGTNEQSSSASRTLSLNSTYSIAGFSMNGSYLNMVLGLDRPDFLVSGVTSKTENHSNSLLYNVSHRLPLHGFINGSAMRFRNTSAFLDNGSDSTTKTYTVNASIFPWSRVSVSSGMNYSDNLNGSLNQRLIEQGAAPIAFLGGGSSHSMNVYANAGMLVVRGLSVNANVNHITQQWGGTDHSSTQFSGTATYSYAHRFLGSLTFSGGAVDTATQMGNGGVGLVGNVNFSRKFGHWDTSANFGYSQNVQTLVAVYTTSSYSYGANVRRRFGNRSLSTYFSGAHSGLQLRDGNQSHTENLGMNFGSRRFSLSGNWGQSMGMSILTPAGLVAAPTTIPVSLLPPESVVIYNGTHYGFGTSFNAIRNLTLFGNYSHSDNSTIAGLKSTLGNTSMLNATLRYPFRKMYFNAGYTRLAQTVTTTGGSPVVISSYYFGISRWFNFF